MVKSRLVQTDAPFVVYQSQQVAIIEQSGNSRLIRSCSCSYSCCCCCSKLIDHIHSIVTTTA